jgi:hypothetical protein
MLNHWAVFQVPKYHPLHQTPSSIPCLALARLTWIYRDEAMLGLEFTHLLHVGICPTESVNSLL